MATEGEPVKVEGGHVSVTTISMSGPETSNGQFSYSSSGVRISVSSDPHDEDSTDAEISKIDFTQHQYEVNMRNKKKRSSSGQEAGDTERPMSWEGELSDSEMVIDTSNMIDPPSSPDLQSSRDSIDTLRNVTIKSETLKEQFQSLDDQRVLDLKYTPLQHQRSLSMNRISVLTESAPLRRPSSPAAKMEQSPLPQPPGEIQNLTIKKESRELSELKCEPSVGMDKLLGALHGSPLLGRLPRVQSSASTDSAVHSMYTHSVYSSPSASPRASRHYTPSLSRNNSDASHSSCYSYSSEFSPTHSPVQGRHPHVVYREQNLVFPGSPQDDEEAEDRLHHHQGISRQQLINSPCPICGDKISGFHYGIFSCESCKGFFKRTVQNRKNYMCLRGGNCPVTVATRKKCPACRFDKCLGCGMKLEAIREDRTRGGRSTYQCSYTLSGAVSTGSLLSAPVPPTLRHASSLTCVNGPGSYSRGESSSSRLTPDIPPLLQEIMDVEHLWQYNETELSRLGKSGLSPSANPLLAASGITAHNSSPDFLADLCNIADHRLYKIVKWCKSLPLFKNISIDDQIRLLINSWCELLVLSCCYRGVGTVGEVRVGGGRGINLQQSAKMGLTPCIERMLSFTDHLRRLRVDRYEYVALKVIVLLTSDAPELHEAEKVRASQEKALAALQAYTAAHSPDTPAKFGELLLRIPELQRTCQFFMQVGKEMLNPANKNKDGDGPSFNLLMELLRGQFSYSSSGVRISVSSHPHDEDSTDAEISKIDFTQHQYEVNMRNKKKRSSSGQEAGDTERPMSWEGELSDWEMVIDASKMNDPDSSPDLQSSRYSIDTLGNVTIKSETLKEQFQSLDDQRVLDLKYTPLQHQKESRELYELKCEPSVGMDKLLGALHGSPLLGRLPLVQSSASTDSAVHSMYTHSVYSSPSASPSASRHYTPSLSRNNSDASSEVQGRHPHVVYREQNLVFPGSPQDDEEAEDRLHHHQGISRQQLINSPCPICGDKIKGFHYGIFSCEPCKGFFKRTVQNRKNYMCLRCGNCPVTVATRKNCPACRFDKCLDCGMKLEAIREDRTRGGRSTYQCSYTLSGAVSTGSSLSAPVPPTLRHASSLTCVNGPGSYSRGESSSSRLTPDIPPLLQEIMDVEHLWQYNETELSRLGKSGLSPSANPLLAASGITAHNSSPDFLADLCNIADHRLYKIVKWCKSLPLFKNISIDDQIRLLINSWCELLVLSCCYRGVGTVGEVRVGGGRGINLQQSAKMGLTPCIERMLSFTDHLRRLRVDRYEYVALKVIVLLTSDAPELHEAEKVRASQEKALAALQAYTAAHSPDTPAKFGELLLRIPELQRTCQFFMQVGKEMLNPANKNKDGDGPSFNLLMELLRGQFSYSSSGVRISVSSHPHDEDSTDAEISKIDFTQHQYEVNMRNKKKRSSSGQEAGDTERPMSWEGELSDWEMVIDASKMNDPDSSPDLQSSRYSIDTLGNVTIKSETLKEQFQSLDDQRVLDLKYTPLQHQKESRELYELKCEPSVGMDKLLGALHGSPLLGRLPLVQSSASTDSAVHSMYTHSVYSSPSASPSASRHYTPSLSRNNSDASSEVQGRHPHVVYREQNLVFPGSPQDDEEAEDRLHHHQGISRQQLINRPCPICGDKIKGFHYGIFSCEPCKGFFKRTVQNRKNYMCLRCGNCPVTVATRKNCPACRFDKCLDCGMKLEAIREDRTRGGRSTYQCSYTLSGAVSTGSSLSAPVPPTLRHASSLTCVNGPGSYSRGESSSSRLTPDIPPLLQEIMDVEHLWQYNETELSRLGKSRLSPSANPLLAASGITAHNSSPDFPADFCNIADHRLYKMVKWCKSLPLFKNISIDDQIRLLINSWCELLVLSCCYRGVGTAGEVRVGGGRGINLQQSAKMGLTPCIERMLSVTNHLHRLRVDRYEYVALKVIVLLNSDAPELHEAEKVRASQEKALIALQVYTAAHSPDTPAKFGELLLRIPELQRTCQFFMQVGKEMLNPANKNKYGDGPSFNLLMELIRGDH